MSDFARDDGWQRARRKELLIPWYELLVARGRIASFRDASIEEQGRGDTIITAKSGEVVGLEEKIVRWPGYDYTALTLEVESCSIAGRFKIGWMGSADYDWLLHVKVSEDERSARCAIIDFKALQPWFWRQDFARWHEHIEKQINRTKSRIIPYADMQAAGIDVRYFDLSPQLSPAK